MPTSARLLVAALMLLGSAGAQTTMLSLTGTVPFESLGAAVAAAGDVNGDGFPDVAVGAPRPTSTPGYVRIISGYDRSVIRTINGVAAGDEFGGWVFNAGDIDGDGMVDIAASAWNGAGGAGHIRIISGATGGIIRTIVGPTALSHLKVADAGMDFDNDGVPDICGITVHPVNDIVIVYSGATGAILASVGSGAYGLGGGGFEFSAAFLTDVNGDGFDELLVGSIASYWPYGHPDTGRVVGFLGPTAIHSGGVNGPNSNAQLGIAVRDVGDINGDGTHDIGASATNSAGPPLGGFTQIFSGSGGTLLYTLSNPNPTFGAPPFPGFGGRMARLGDVTGDGIDDFGLAAGGLSVISGASGTIFFSVTGSDGSVDGAGDVNGDSVPDIVIGDAVFGPGQSFGRMRVISGTPLGLASTTNLGGACGAFTTVLTATAPLIGGTLTVSLSGAMPSAVTNLAIDLAAPVPFPFGSCTWHLDLAHVATWVLVPLSVSGTGAANLSGPIPSIPTIVQASITLQAVVFGTPSPLGFDVSNGVRLTLGF